MKKLLLVSALLIGAFFNGYAQKADSLAKKSSIVKIRSIKNPIYSIDGIKQEHSEFTISNLNPDSIAEVKILKNEDAIKLFGAEAIDGVILITTKSGKNNATNLELEQRLNLISGTKGTSELTHFKIYGNAPTETDSIKSISQPHVVFNGINANKSAFNNVMYILDGQKIEKSYMDSLNTDTIKSITVLKNDSAVAKYGLQASNGVVLITTKTINKTKFPDKPANKTLQN